MHVHGRYPDGFHPYFSSLVQGFILAAGRRGLAMKFSASPDGRLDIDRDYLSRHGASGLCISQPRRSDLEAAITLGFPVVQMSGYWDDLPADRVATRHDRSLGAAIRHLHTNGHQRITYVDSRRRHNRPLLATCAEVYDCLPDDAPVDEIIVDGWDPEAAARAVRGLEGLGDRATAVMVGDDILLRHILRRSREQGIEPLQRWEFVGWGTPFSVEWIGEDISMIETHPFDLADAVVTLLQEQIEDGRPSGKVGSIASTFVAR